MPVDPQFIASPKDNISKLRADHALYLYKPEDSEVNKLFNPSPSGNAKPAELRQTIQCEVGGVAGIGASTARATISLDKLRFAPGEKTLVHIDMDNSKCKKPVKSFKCKLFRKISCLGGKSNMGGKPLFSIESFLKEEKYDGCSERVNHTRTID